MVEIIDIGRALLTVFVALVLYALYIVIYAAFLVLIAFVVHMILLTMFGIDLLSIVTGVI